MIEELAKNDLKWRKIATRITNGNRSLADDIVNEMYLRRMDNDRGQPITEYYVILTMKSIYLNQKTTNKLICVNDLRVNEIEDEPFEIDDECKEFIDRFNQLGYKEKELIELFAEYDLELEFFGEYTYY
jgi:hypothetical protein